MKLLETVLGARDTKINNIQLLPSRYSCSDKKQQQQQNQYDFTVQELLWKSYGKPKGYTQAEPLTQLRR